jgi:hypothetical protein
VEVPLPLVEVWEELQPAVEHLTGLAGFQILGAVIEDGVSRRVGPRHRPDPASNSVRWGQQVLVVALGIETGGTKHVLGLWQGATETTTVVQALLEDLVARGLNPERRYLFVIDGAKALRAGIERVFGERAEVQRCQIHKRRNVKEHLPTSAQGDTDRRIRNAYAMTNYAGAKSELGKIFRQLEGINLSAARSL